MLNRILTLPESSLKENLPYTFQFLLDKGILAPTRPVDNVKCRDCDIDHFEQIVEINHRYFTKCEYNEYASLSEVQAPELNSYRFNLTALLEWFSKESKISIQIKRVNEETWYLGKNIDRNMYFIFSTSLDDTINEAGKINTENNIFIWLGNKPLTGFSTIEMVSIQDIFKYKGGGLYILPYKTKPNNVKPNQKDIILDRDIVLTDDFHLLLDFENGTYNHSVKTYPQTYRIVRYLYDQRKYGKYYSSKELGENLHFGIQRVIPTRIKELNNICSKHRVKQVILSFPNKTWALNPDLNCFK